MTLQQAKRRPPSKEAAAIAAEAGSLEATGKLAGARSAYERLLQLDRRNVALLTKLGIIAARLHDLHGAAAYFRQAAKLDPGNREIGNNLATVLLQVGRPDKAEAVARQWLREDSASVETFRILFECCNQLGRPKEAREFLEKAIALRPGDLKLTMDMAHSYDMSSEPEKARVLYQQLISTGQAGPYAYNALARVQTYSAEPPELSQVLDKLTSRTLPKFDKALLHHTAGKILDDLGRYGEAIDHFASGRSVLAHLGSGRGAIPADQLDRHGEIFTKQFFTERVDFGSKSQRPVFIFGMPRSGTTLVEQIIASHPKAHGAGELRFFNQEVARLTGRRSTLEDTARGANALTREASQEIARNYLDLLTAYSADAERVTDKLPHNFERLWLLALAFPEASFIHCRRDPVATCVSCFIQPLNQFHGYAENWKTLGHYYRSYERLMELWREVLPINMLEIDYEQLVRDQEPQIRRIIDHVGLKWDDACLSSHETKRSVQTPSRRQVEKPIHTGAITNWRRFEPYLGPLFEALGEPARPAG